MKKNAIRNTGIEITEISLGTWAVGDGYFGKVEEEDTINSIHSSIDLGINYIDTAYIYGKGLSEELVGKAVKEIRNNLVISTKIWINSFKKDSLLKACDESLSRLQTDYIDVLFLHYFVPKVPLEETMEAMSILKKQGKIRAIGVSNFSVEQLKSANGIEPVDIIQPCYSLLWRDIEKEMLPYCTENNIAVVAYSPLAQGLLTGKFTNESNIDDGRKKAPLFSEPYYSQCLEITKKLTPFAEKYGKTPAQIAIRWVCQTKGITSAIVGAKSAKQAEENSKASDFELSQYDYEAISLLSKEFSDNLPKFKNFFTKEIII